RDRPGPAADPARPLPAARRHGLPPGRHALGRRAAARGAGDGALGPARAAPAAARRAHQQPRHDLGRPAPAGAEGLPGRVGRRQPRPGLPRRPRPHPAPPAGAREGNRLGHGPRDALRRARAVGYWGPDDQGRGPMRSSTRKYPAAAAAVLLALAAACGGDTEEATEGAPAVAAAAETRRAVLELVDGWAAVHPEGAGTVEVAADEDGTTVTLAVSGLDPETEYPAHVHDGACDAEPPGGRHWRA